MQIQIEADIVSCNLQNDGVSRNSGGVIPNY